MAEILKAPWTPGQIKMLDERQTDGRRHPHTCICGYSLEAFGDGWHCENQCGYTQDWCYKADAEIEGN